MKKLLAIVLLFSYSLCAAGVKITMHHCMGEYKYFNFLQEKKKKCCKGKEMPKGCCKTNTVEFKKTDDKGQGFLSFTPKTVEFNTLLSFTPFIPPVNKVNYQVVVSNYRLRPPPLRPADLPLYRPFRLQGLIPYPQLMLLSWALLASPTRCQLVIHQILFIYHHQNS
jgi:hypothetical protein